MTPVPGNQWCLDIQAPDESDRREGVFVSDAETYELEGSRGTANFVVKFGGSRKQAHLNVVEIKNTTRALTGDDANTFVPVVAFDCRGLEVVGWHPQSDFEVTGEAANFGSVDLSDGEWADYDEEADLSVSITGLTHKIEVQR
eukprot:CAMPEP_0117748562 /NCGR_PEP_ID=MMETSP0947-20121206/9207_1 /TAXON_ID=44440 /ORGANISM="Chattonella subsalsa, Strain CCMP2191" /LENGTH=142 /DNA_ID=CAMNT_0005566283 /DNA_START=222 /DNA_END=650 /DNA_ORIENTATION=-